MSGDFNRDGLRDLAVANGSSNNVSILIGNGAGSFAAPVNYAAGTSPSAIINGDFNRDGNDDLIVANSGSNNVSILLGSAGGTFSSAVNVAAGTMPKALANGDFNRDGMLDVAVANYDSNDITILLGNGAGALTFKASYFGAGNPDSLVAADFDTDGVIDLAAGNTGPQYVTIYKGHGDGTFNNAAAGPSFTGLKRIVAADVNGDGKVDLVAGSGASAVGIGVALGQGNLGFGFVSYYLAGVLPTWVIAADFTGDGKLDLAVVNDADVISVIENTGSNTFGNPVQYAVNTGPSSIVAGDWNGDGRADVAVTNASSDDVSILLNGSICRTNCGRFGVAASNYPSAAQPYSAATSDFNHDGIPDIAVAGTNISVRLGNVSGGFSPAVNYPAGTFPTSIATGDFNRDGNVDMAVTNFISQNFSILTGSSSGSFSAATYALTGWTAGQLSAVAVGDFNRDGIEDLIIADGSANRLYIVLGVGNGTFGPATVFASTLRSFGLVVADFNRDGKLDVAAADNNSPNVAISLGNGDGTFGTKTNYGVGTNTAFAIAGGDFNGDGVTDLAVTRIGLNTVSVLIGSGTGTFAPVVHYNVGTAPRGMVATDVDGDGRVDLAVANRLGNNVTVLLNAGSGTFGAAVQYGVGSSPYTVLAADLDRDGKPDLLVPNNVSNDVSVLLNQCPVTPDLMITKTHSDFFIQGDTGKTFTLTVSNIGGPPTSGLVSVTDYPPIGSLIVTGMSGSGWSCIVAAATCSRSDALNGAATYPTITVTATVSSSAAVSVVNQAIVSGGADANGANNLANDPFYIGLQAPPNVVASADSDTQVTISWGPVSQALFYSVQRSADNSNWETVATPLPPATGQIDVGLTADTAYLYRVYAYNATTGYSQASNIDIATTIIFTDDPLNMTTRIKFDHWDQLRRGVNAAHRAAGLGDATFTNVPAGANSAIKATDIMQLRSNLDAARSAVTGLPAIPYFQPTIGTGSYIYMSDFQEIRTGVK